MKKVETVSRELIKRIYLHINRTEKQAQLLSNRQKWDRLTAALNVLEDTSWAIDYYLENDYPTDLKGKYLFTYGLLQALFVQEDAINSIYYVFYDKNIDFKTNYPQAYEIREMRNDVVGHPTFRNGTNYIFLAQNSLRKDQFYYIKEDSNTGKFNNVGVDIMAAISDQSICINSILNDAIAEMDGEFRQYIEQHRGRKMNEIFNQLQYAKEKVLSSDYMGAWGYEATKIMVKKCEEELILRYGKISAVDSYRYLLEEIHEVYLIIDEELSTLEPGLQMRLKKYMLQVLFSKLEELAVYCKETDEYFENYGEEDVSEKTDITIVFVETDELKK